MGTWSSSPFGNDTAKDWAWGLSDAGGSALIDRTIQAVVTAKKDIDAPIAEEAIAAATVVAAAAGDPIRGVSADIKRWINTQGYVPTKKLIGESMKAIDRITRDSELRDLWDESHGLEGWVKATAKVRDKLVEAKKSALPKRKPKKPGTPRALYKMLERYDEEPSDELKARIRRAVERIKDPNRGGKETKHQEPLSLVARRGLIDEVRLLLEMGADPSGYTAIISAEPPFVAACVGGHLEVAELLREAGADVHEEVERDLENEFLGDAILAQMEVRGVEPKKRGYRYCLALFAVARRGTPEAVEYLLSLGADLNQSDLNGETLMHKAAEGNNVAMLRYLAEKGLDINARVGKTAEAVVHSAVERKAFDALKFLLENGADPNPIESYEGSEHQWYNTPLDMAAGPHQKKNRALLRKHGGKTAKEIMGNKP